MPRNNLILELPVELACEILCKWVLLKDVVQMDRAVCETALRRVLFDHVYRSPHCILTDMPDLKEVARDQLIDWLAIRSLRVETLYICESDEGMDVYEEHIRNFGKRVQCARVYGVDGYVSDSVLSLVAQECVNLRHLLCVDVSAIQDVIGILQSCVKLDTIELRSVYTSDENDRQFAKDLPVSNHLQLKSLELDCDPLSSECVFKCCSPEAILRLRVFLAASYVPNYSQFANLRTLGFAESEEMQDGDLIDIITLCPWIVNLDISACMEITDEGITTVVEIIEHLHSINIEGNGYSGDVIDNIVDLHGPTLHTLLVYGTGVADIGVNKALTYCPNLHTISFSHDTDIDFSLMGSINTLFLDLTYDEGVWCTIERECRQLQHLHVVLHKNIKTKSKGLQNIFLAMQCIISLQTVHINDKDLYLDIGVELDELRAQRPSLRIIHEERNAWKNHF